MKKGKSKKPLDSASVCGREDPAAVREFLTKVGDKWSIFLYSGAVCSINCAWSPDRSNGITDTSFMNSPLQTSGLNQ